MITFAYETTTAMLTYKTQAQVSAIVRRFWGSYFGCLFSCILLGIGMLYGSASMDTVFRVQPGFTLAEGLMLAGLAVLLFGGFSFVVIAQLAQNMSAGQVSNSKCERLVEWMDAHPEIHQHIEQIRAERPVLVYDYGIMKDWVAGHEERQRTARQEAACKQVHGIA